MRSGKVGWKDSIWAWSTLNKPIVNIFSLAVHVTNIIYIQKCFSDANADCVAKGAAQTKLDLKM